MVAPCRWSHIAKARLVNPLPYQFNDIADILHADKSCFHSREQEGTWPHLASLIPIQLTSLACRRSIKGC